MPCFSPTASRRAAATPAREKLAHFWERLSRTAAFGPFGSSAHFAPGGAAGAISLWTRLLSPYQFNPLDVNPLRTMLNEEVDFERLRFSSPIGLLIAATRVVDGRARMFSNAEINADVVLASACLPLYHHAVTIDNVAYWDGGYSANPPLLDLVAVSRAPDLLIVQITPALSTETPTSAQEIMRRLDQITFNSSLQAELASSRAAHRAQPPALRPSLERGAQAAPARDPSYLRRGGIRRALRRQRQ